jgi:hypothetical protein
MAPPFGFLERGQALQNGLGERVVDGPKLACEPGIPALNPLCQIMHH